jgi:hypothetical protein
VLPRRRRRRHRRRRRGGREHLGGFTVGCGGEETARRSGERKGGVSACFLLVSVQLL